MGRPSLVVLASLLVMVVALLPPLARQASSSILPDSPDDLLPAAITAASATFLAQLVGPLIRLLLSPSNPALGLVNLALAPANLALADLTTSPITLASGRFLGS